VRNSDAAKIAALPDEFGSGAIAQLGERIVRNDEVVGSSPTSSTKFSITYSSALAQFCPILSQKFSLSGVFASIALVCSEVSRRVVFGSCRPIGVTSRLPRQESSEIWTYLHKCTRSSGVNLNSSYSSPAFRWGGVADMGIEQGEQKEDGRMAVQTS
jgi:hypothetical protein